MSFGRYRRLLWGIVWLGAAQFVVLSGAAMWAYPGGSEFAPSADRYRFWANTLSDLGRTQTRSGVDNTVSAILYHTALGLLVFSLMSAWWVLPSLTPHRRRSGRLVRIAGLLSVGGSFGVALTPADVLPVWHGVTIGIAAVPGLVAIVAFVVACWRDGSCPRWIAAWATAVLVSAGAHFLQYARHYWLGGVWTPGAPAVQKIFAMLAIGFLLVVSGRCVLRVD